MMTSQTVTVISIPVADQDRAKAFYADILDFVSLVDSPFEAQGATHRWIQLAPRADAETSISLMSGLIEMAPGSLKGLILKVDDIADRRATLLDRGTAVGEIQETPWGRFANFSDPDGNGWTLHEMSDPAA